MSKITGEGMKNVLDTMHGIFVTKNQKYGGSFESSLDKYGSIAALVRIGDKFNRVENLIINSDDGTPDESVIDTLIDMANYCVMTAVYMQAGGVSNE